MLTKETFLQNLTELVGNPAGKSFLLALSGGADSCVTAYLMKQCGLHFAAAHCNFHLRDEESNQDTEFVKRIPYLSDVDIFIKEFETKKIQKESGKSVEMVARELRYDWFRSLQSDFDYVVTAHNADDNAETLLLNLARGTGLRGLCGIPKKVDGFVRPMLPFSAQEIREFAKNNGIAYRDDSSNFSTIYQRNKIRWDIFPKLKEINPQIVPVFGRNIDLLSRQCQIYEATIAAQKSQVLTQKGEKMHISIEELKKMPDVPLLLYEILSDFHFNKSVIKEIEESLDKISGKTFYSTTHRVVKERDSLLVLPLDGSPQEEMIIHDEFELRQAGFEISYGDDGEDIMKEKDNRNVVFVAAEKFAYPLVLRPWRPGDDFCPFGMKGRKKLSDFFKDEKMDAAEKAATRLLCHGEEVMWVVGLRADDRFRVASVSPNGFYRIEKKQ